MYCNVLLYVIGTLLFGLPSSGELILVWDMFLVDYVQKLLHHLNYSIIESAMP